MRQVENVSLPQTREAKQEPYAQPVDTYVRPEQQLPSSAMEIINSIVSITPELQKYVQKQQEKHRTFGEAVGAKLFADAQAINLEGTPEEIKEAMRNGDLRGATAYNKHVRNGIVKMQFKTFANKVKQDTANWYDTAVVQDRDGTMKHISDIDDMDIFNKEYYAEVARLGQDSTGGAYSPTLYDALVSGTVTEMHNRITDIHIAIRTSKVQKAQVQNITEFIDSGKQQYIDENNVIGNKEGTTAGMLAIYQDVLNNPGEYGVGAEMARAVVVANIEASLNDVGVKGIEMLEGVAQLIPEIWNDPKVRQEIQKLAASATSRRLAREKAEDEAEEYRQQKATRGILLDLAKEYGDGDLREVPPEKLYKLIRDYPLMGEEIHSIISAQQQAFETAYGAATEAEFNTLAWETYSGNLTVSGILAKGTSLSHSQRKELMTVAYQKEERDRARENRNRERGAQYSYFKKDPKTARDQVMARLGVMDAFKYVGPTMQGIIIGEVDQLLGTLVPEILHAESKYPDNPFEALAAAEKIVAKYATDEKLADIVQRVVAQGDAMPIDVPRYPEARITRIDKVVAEQLHIKGVTDKDREAIGAIELRVRTDINYQPTEADYQIFKKAYGPYCANDETKIRAELNKFVKAIKELEISDALLQK